MIHNVSCRAKPLGGPPQLLGSGCPLVQGTEPSSQWAEPRATWLVITHKPMPLKLTTWHQNNREILNKPLWGAELRADIWTACAQPGASMTLWHSSTLPGHHEVAALARALLLEELQTPSDMADWLHRKSGHRGPKTWEIVKKQHLPLQYADL